ncbi:MAG: glycosyltransferase family 4 protein [[Pasteurella] mairii]|uniref:GDP-mannose-dependent alpha-(1-6)-phosphatidylinositol monomannoside mannosyltransferase n=1 Tax=[Pasteurella] mairii TaxID=757 RepID=A0A379B643_9PAST|nr:glycosyltransferase family 4 protein [[Pasteurella] mairii]SUB34103.1 GDP-mannose-dependent alpha-(1-6)-phosphatidylinositol monomannoside mannosyltransferase [[Pasteurella] mairii]
MANQRPAILFINMAKGFGGGEYQSAQLIKHVSGYDTYFLGKKSGKFIPHLQENLPQTKIVNLWLALKLIFTRSPLIIHALDGQGAHFASWFKRLSGKPTMITRRISVPFRHKSSARSYQNVDMVVGVSHQVTDNMRPLNTNVRTIYGSIKPLQENHEFEQRYFAAPKAGLRVAHIGNLLKIKNFPLTIELARQFPQVTFYIVGSGVLEAELKQQAEGISNIEFIPFNPYVGSVLKQVDLQLVPSHSEGMGFVILEGYLYKVPVLAHKTGGIPEIVQHGKTGFLIENNDIATYQTILQQLVNNPEQLQTMQNHIADYMQNMDFSVERMTKEYEDAYQVLLTKR